MIESSHKWKNYGNDLKLIFIKSFTNSCMYCYFLYLMLFLENNLSWQDGPMTMLRFNAIILRELIFAREISKYLFNFRKN